MTIYPAHFFAAEYPPHDPARTYTLDDGEFSDRPSNGDNARSAPAAPDTDTDEEFSDIIINLLHLAHSKDCDLQYIITSALNNFHAEAASLTETPAA